MSLTEDGTFPNLVNREQEEELNVAIGDLGRIYNLYRKQLSELQQHLTKDEWAQVLSSKGLPLDDQNFLLGKFTKLHENPMNLESFHRTTATVLSDFLGSNTDFLTNSDPLKELERETKSRLDILAGDKIYSLLNQICLQIRQELERKSMNLLFLYEEEELSMLIKEKRLRGLRRFLMQDRYVKMDIPTQIKILENERRELIWIESQLRVEDIEWDTSNDEFLAEWLRKHSDCKELVYSLFEDRIICLLLELSTDTYKTGSLKSFLSQMPALSNLIYLRDYSFSIDRYFTNFLVKGSSYISNKKTLSNIKDDGLISINFLEHLCDFNGDNATHNFLKFNSNQYFDNLTIAADTLDILYHSYTTNSPKILLMIKNLFGSYMDEVDNSDNLVYDNPLDVSLDMLYSIGKRLNGQLMQGVFGTNMHSIITAEEVEVKRTDFIAAIFAKFDTNKRSVEALNERVTGTAKELFQKQNRHFIFYDYEDLEKLIIFSDTRFKLKDKNNPNQCYLDEVNNLVPTDIVRIKKIPKNYMGEIGQLDFEWCDFGDCFIHPQVNTIFEALLSTNQDFFNEKMEVYLQARKAEIYSKPTGDTEPVRLQDLSHRLLSTNYYLMSMLTRNSLIRILSYLNYFVSIKLSLGKRSSQIVELTNGFEDIESLRLKHLQGFVKRRQQNDDTSSANDDSKLELSKRANNEEVEMSSRRYSLSKRKQTELEEVVEVKDEGEIPPPIIASQRTHTDVEPSQREAEQAAESPLPQIKEFNKVFDSASRADRLHTFKQKIKQSEIFDDAVFETIDCNLQSQYTHIKIIDHLEQEIIYDEAINSFEKLLNELKLLVSFFIQNNLVDYCFSAVITTEQVSGDLKDNSVNLNHLRFTTKPLAQQLNYEYLVYQICNSEADFQEQKAQALKIYMEILKHSISRDSFDKTMTSLKALYRKRPKFDVRTMDVLTEVITEVCNSKTNSSSISTKDVCKDIQNFIITIFDEYRNCTKELKDLCSLLSDILNEQYRLWSNVDILPDIKNGEHSSRGRLKKFVELQDNLEGIGELYSLLNKTTEEVMVQLPLAQIDALSMADFTIEENRSLYFKAIQVKMSDSISGNTVLGKGVKESTYVYFLRVHLMNRLLHRKEFVRGSLRIAVLKEMKACWKRSLDSLAERLFRNEETGSAIDAKERWMKKECYYSVESVIKSFEDEKKAHVYAANRYINKKGPHMFDKKKTVFTVLDWRTKMHKLNSAIAVYMSLKYQQGLREELNSIEGWALSSVALQNLGRPRRAHSTQLEGAMAILENIVSFQTLSSIRLSSIHRLLKSKMTGKLEIEDYQKRMGVFGDCKFLYEYLVLCHKYLKLTQTTNALSWTQHIQQVIDDICKVFPNSSVANSLITSIGIVFDAHSSNPVVISDHGQTLITSIENNEIIYGSENESVVRRIVLQTFLDTMSSVIWDELAELDSLKKDIASKYNAVQNVRKQNYSLQTTPQKANKMKKNRASGSSELPPCLVSSSQELLCLQVSLHRLNILNTLKHSILSDNSYSFQTLNQIFPYLRTCFRTISENLLAENINLFFWKSVCQKPVTSNRMNEAAALNLKQSTSHEALTAAEKRTQESILLLGINTPKHDVYSCLHHLHRYLTPSELNALFNRQSRLCRLADPTFEEESLSPKIEIYDQTLPSTLSVQEVEDTEHVNQSSLSKIIGNLQQKKKKETRMMKHESQESMADEIRLMGRNYVRNTINYIVEEVDKIVQDKGSDKKKKSLLKKDQDPHGDEDKRVESVTDKPLIDNIKKIKFRVGSLAKVQFEELDEKPKGRQVGEVTKDWVGKTIFSMYANFSAKRTLALRLFKVLYLLSNNLEEEEAPFYIVPYFTSPELRLNDHKITDSKTSSNIAPFNILRSRAIYRGETQLKLLDFKEFDQILIEFDRYVKEIKKRSNSPVYSYLKTNGLFSLINTKPADESIFRYTDIRLRVFLYDLKNRFIDSLLSTKDWFSLLISTSIEASNPAMQDSIKPDPNDMIKTLEKQSEKFQQETSFLQKTLQVSALDLLLKADWADNSHYQLLDEQENKKLSEWVTLLQRKSVILPERNQNITLSNKCLDLHSYLHRNTVWNNIVLRSLQEFTGDISNEQEIYEATVKLPKTLKLILSKKYLAMTEIWKETYPSSAQIRSISLRWTLKSLQIIRLIQYHKASHDAIGSTPTILLPHKYSNLFINLKRPLRMTYIQPQNEYEQSHKLKVNTQTLQSRRQAFLRYFMSRLLVNFIIRDKKYKELHTVLEKFKENTKKDQEVIVKNNEYDHIYNMSINFCKMVCSMQAQKMLKPPKTLWPTQTKHSKDSDSTTSSQPPYLSSDLLNKYIDTAANSSFIIPYKEVLVGNMPLILAELAKTIIHDQTEVYTQSCILLAASKPRGRRAGSSVANSYRNRVNYKDKLHKSVMGQNETKLLPFVVNFLTGFIGKSYNMITNNEEEGYLVSKEDFLELVVVLMHESSSYINSLHNSFKEHFLLNYIHAVYAKFVTHSTLQFLKHNFTKMIKEFHKLIEGRLAEQNFSVIFELDRYSKFIKYNAYDSTILLDKLQEKITADHSEELKAVSLKNQQVSQTRQEYEKLLAMNIKDCIFKTHNEKMSELEGRMKGVLEEDVTLFDRNNGEVLSAEKIRNKLVDEEAGKTAGLLARMKEMFRKKVEEEIMKVEKETQVLSEETDKEENIKRKIRELIVREGLLKEELAATKTEMDALGQQNEVLGRDIHTCNYERVNLTTQLQKSKKEYEDLKRKIEEKKASQKKAHQQFISKHTHVSNESDHRNTTKQEGTSAVLAQGGDKIEAETINERKSIKFSSGTGALGGLEIRKIEEDAADYDIDEDDDQLPVISEGNRSNNLKTSKNNLRVKKSKKKMYAFVNGKLERRFVIDDK